MDLSGVNIKRGKIGAAVNGNPDAISGLLIVGTGVVATAELALTATKRITTRQEATDLGITADYDKMNAVRAYRHIDEFFRIAGEGTPLYIMLYAGVPSEALFDAEDADNDTPAKIMIAAAKGEIRHLAIAYSPAEPEEPEADELVDGLDAHVRAAILPAQHLALWAAETFRPLQVVLEGRGFTPTPSGALNLRGIEAGAGEILKAEKVSICIGQDYDYAETQDAAGKKFADVGTMLGCIASKPVSENIGEVGNTNLADVTKMLWLNAALSNHSKVEDMDKYLSLLDDRGYIFAISYTGMAGYYWNNDHTCTPVIKDENNNINESSISLGRTMDKAIRELRVALLPKVKSTQSVDAKGKLPAGVVKYFEQEGDKVFDRMADVISFGKTKIDPNSDLLVIPRNLNVSFSIVPKGQIYAINGSINLKTQL